MKHLLFALVLVMVAPSFGQVGGDIQFITHVYRILLNRAAEPNAYIVWATPLLIGSATRPQTINDILNSAEYRNNPALQDKNEGVRRAYRTILQREPQDWEVEVWAPQPWATIFQGFYGSAEYQANPRATSDDELALGGSLEQDLAAVDGSFEGDLAVVDGGFEGDLAVVDGGFDGDLAVVDGGFEGDFAQADSTNTNTNTATSAGTPAFAYVLFALGAVVLAAMITVQVLIIKLKRTKRDVRE